MHYKNGIPSKNTYARVFSSLDPNAVKQCFISWVQSFQLAAYVTDQLDWLEERSQWRDLKTIFISSLSPSARQLTEAIRTHWAIENSLHWGLDVTLREDEPRIRKDHAPENMAMIRHVVLNMLQNTKKGFKDMSIKHL